MMVICKKKLCVLGLSAMALFVAAGCSQNNDNGTVTAPVPRFQPGTPTYTADQRASIQAGLAKVQADNTIPPSIKAQEIATMQSELGPNTANPRPPGFNTSASPNP